MLLFMHGRYAHAIYTPIIFRMNKKNIQKKLVSVKIQPRTLKKLKLLAARQGMFMSKFLATLIDRIAIPYQPQNDDY